MSHLTDDRLLQRFAESRDTEAFHALVARHAGLVHATCRRETGDDALAEDAAQAVFLLLARKARALRGERSLASWLFVAARNAARNLVREERRRKAREAHALPPEPTMNETWDALEPHLNDALGRLSATDRQAVILRYLEGHSLAEVAQEMGLKENAARMRVDRAIERLRAGLSRAGVAASVVVLVALLERDAQAAVPPRLLAVSVPPAAPPGVGAGAWPFLAKGLSLTLATTTTKALAASTAALVLAGGFVVARHRAIDDATVRAAFRPLLGTWKGTTEVPMPPDGKPRPTTMLLDVRPENDGLGLAVTLRFPDQHQGQRKHLAIDPAGRLLVTDVSAPPEVYHPKGLREFAAAGRGLLAFEGRAEPGRGGDIKLSFEVKDGKLTLRQSSKPDGEPEHGVVAVLERAK